MATRQELGAELMRRMQDLLDRIYRDYMNDAGQNYVSNSRMATVHRRSREYENELQAIIDGVGRQYLTLAPEMRRQFNDNVAEVRDAIRDFRNEVERVYYANPLITRVFYESVPVYRPVTDSFCLLVREILDIHPIDRELVGRRTVPVMEYRNEYGRVVGRRRL